MRSKLLKRVAKSFSRSDPTDARSLASPPLLKDAKDAETRLIALTLDYQIINAETGENLRALPRCWPHESELVKERNHDVEIIFGRPRSSCLILDGARRIESSGEEKEDSTRTESGAEKRRRGRSARQLDASRLR